MSKSLILFNELQAEITSLVAPMRELQVADLSTSSQAIEAAKTVKVYLKRVEDKRREIVDPMNAEVKRINDYVKQITAPLIDAETTIKRELVRFETEQERIRAEERQRLENERRQREAELARQQEEERAKAQAAQADGTADAIELFGAGSDEEIPLDTAAIEEKHIDQRYSLQNEMAQRQDEIDDQRIKNIRKTWKCEVTDINLVPKDFLIVTLNEKMVLAAARGGNTNIPGVRLWQESSLAIGRNTYVPSIGRTRAE